jgi:branched-chain amino acid aminotransferase
MTFILQAYNRTMITDTIKAWEISPQKGVVELSLPDMSSLDAITRQLSQGYYTTFRTYDGGKRVLGLRAHLRRLYQPVAGQEIEISLPARELRQILAGILKAHSNEARVRLVRTGMGQFFIALEPLKPLPPEVYSQGVKVVTTDVERQSPRLKSTAFISASQSTRTQLAESDVFEALLVRDGFILEGMTSNFFSIEEGKLKTARKDILLGVTRRTVLRVARGRGLEIVYKPLHLEQIHCVDEAFLTSSSRGIVPVVRIDDVTVGEGRSGPIAKELLKAYDEYVLRVAERF